MRTQSSQQSRRFSFSELITAIALTTMLAGLALPAISASRETARKLSCADNLKQLGLALRTYEQVYKRFPGNGLYFWTKQSKNPHVWQASSHGSQLVKLLPFLNHDKLYKKLDFTTVGIRSEEPFKGASNLETTDVDGTWFRSTVLDNLICPVARTKPHLLSNDTAHAPAVATYGFSIGAQLMKSRLEMCKSYPGNYFKTGRAEHGNDARPDWISGVFARGAWAARLKDISDGQANVIALGETLPMKADFMTRGWASVEGVWAATVAPINYPIVGMGDPGFSWRNKGKDNPFNCSHFTNWVTSQGFKSNHMGGAYFVFVDGSVHFLTETVDYMTYQRLGDRADGRGVEIPKP
jgi:hypothetical protein